MNDFIPLEYIIFTNYNSDDQIGHSHYASVIDEEEIVLLLLSCRSLLYFGNR